MSRRRHSPSSRRSQRPWSARALPVVLGGVFMAIFGGYAVVGPNGLLAWSDYRTQHVLAEHRLAILKTEQVALANRVRLLDPRGANPDLADELVRRELGVIRSDEVVLPIR